MTFNIHNYLRDDYSENEIFSMINYYNGNDYYNDYEDIFLIEMNDWRILEDDNDFINNIIVL